MAAAVPEASAAPHVPVLIAPLIAAVAPVQGTWIDGTYGAGGYTERLLQAGATQVIGIDRDPTAIAAASAMQDRWGDRLRLVQSTFSALDTVAEAVQGVVLDLGVSSMQLDRAERGFSFMRDGPLDMRMGDDGPDAADLLNTIAEGDLADILYHYGEERASRRIARAILAARPLTTTLQLAEVVAKCLPRPKPGQSHPATRSFQAIRIAVNDEFGELIEGLSAAERVLAPGGWLAVVTFHSLEDRVVKRFLQYRGGQAPGQSRYAPASESEPAQFDVVRKAIAPDETEIASNPRARSSRLRLARRTDAPITDLDRSALGLPGPQGGWTAQTHSNRGNRHR